MIYHLIGTFCVMVVEHVYHQICLWHQSVSGSGFYNFYERALATVSCCVHAWPWSQACPSKATLEHKRGDPNTPRKGSTPSIVEGGRRGREAEARGSGQGRWRLLLTSPAPRLSDGLEGAAGSGFLYQQAWQPWTILPATVMNKDTRVRGLTQMTPQRYTVK